MTKKIVAIVLAVLMLGTVLAACGGSTTPSSNTPSSNTPSSNTPSSNTPSSNTPSSTPADNKPAESENKETYLIKFAMADPVGTIFDDYMAQPLIKMLDENSGGRIQCEL